MTKKEMAKIITTLYAYYPNGRNENFQAKVNAWYMIFQDMEYRTVMAAVAAFTTADTAGFFPAPGMIVEKVEMLTRPNIMTENEAWAIVHKAIRNSAYNSREEFEKLPPEIQSVVHDPEQLKAWAIDPNFNMGVESSNFKRSYRARAAQLREFNALPESVRQFAIEAGGGLDLDRYLLPSGRGGGST